MKTLYLECNMGAAGDMLMAALVELLDQPDEFVNEFNNLNIPNIKLIKEESTKCGIVGTHMRVMVNGEEEVSEDVNVQENNDYMNMNMSTSIRITMNMTTIIVMDTTHIVVFLILKRLLMG